MLALKDFKVKTFGGVIGRWINQSMLPSQILIVQTDFSIEIYAKNPSRTTGDLLLYAFAEGVTMCPYLGTKFEDVPEYVSGYGCPVCKGLSYHVPIDK